MYIQHNTSSDKIGYLYDSWNKYSISNTELSIHIFIRVKTTDLYDSWNTYSINNAELSIHIFI